MELSWARWARGCPCRQAGKLDFSCPAAATDTVQGCMFSYAYSTYTILKFQKVLPKNHLAALKPHTWRRPFTPSLGKVNAAHAPPTEDASLQARPPPEARRERLAGHGPSVLRAVRAPQTLSGGPRGRWSCKGTNRVGQFENMEEA